MLRDHLRRPLFCHPIRTPSLSGRAVAQEVEYELSEFVWSFEWCKVAGASDHDVLREWQNLGQMLGRIPKVRHVVLPRCDEGGNPQLGQYL